MSRHVSDSPPEPLTVVGIGADGWDALAPASRDAVVGADVLLGSTRQLALIPDTVPADRDAWPSPLLPALPELLARQRARGRVVVLASGDPLVSGIGGTLVNLLGADAVRILPAVSSVALARARMGWPANSVVVVSAVGRDLAEVVRHLAPRRRIILLSAGSDTAGQLASLLCGEGYRDSRLTVLANLGSAEESRTASAARAWPRDRRAPALNLVCVECVADAGVRVLPGAPGLPDEVFEHDGQLTKRDVRASALARLAPVPGARLWDVGAGAGSVAIEWMRTHETCMAVAIERDPDRAARIGRNAKALGVPSIQIVQQAAPEALTGLPAPDAVFVGGGATMSGVLEKCWEALRPGGRFVVHGVTVQTERLMLQWFSRQGGELIRIGVERAGPLGSFTGWTPARSVTQYAVTKQNAQVGQAAESPAGSGAGSPADPVPGSAAAPVAESPA